MAIRVVLSALHIIPSILKTMVSSSNLISVNIYSAHILYAEYLIIYILIDFARFISQLLSLGTWDIVYSSLFFIFFL